MSLTQPQRIQISGEMIDLPQKIAGAIAAQAALSGVKTELLNEDSSIKIFFDKYNALINSYQNERAYVDGTTYSTVIESDVVNSAKKQPGNKFYPTDGSWINFQPKKDPSSVGLPTTSTPNSELAIFTNSIDNGGLTTLLNFLLNGQSSGVADDTLAADYISGSGTMVVTTGGQTVNKLLLVEGGGFSGLFLTTAVAGVNLTVTEVVVPNGTLPMLTSTVKESITAFTNTERNHLTSSSYQNVITVLSTKIISAVSFWKTAINNQLTQLSANTDNRSPQATEIAAAITDINNALTVINTWQALPNTGTTGLDSKFTNNNIAPLQAEITARTTFSGTRNTQITTALGSITQNPDGTYSGAGLYYLRFQQIDGRINLAGGPLSEFYEKDVSTGALDQMVTNATDRLNTYGSELRTEKVILNADGTNKIKVTSTTGFSNTDTIFIMADSLTELTGTITSIAAPFINLSFTIPNTYTLDKRFRLYKQL